MLTPGSSRETLLDPEGRPRQLRPGSGELNLKAPPRALGRAGNALKRVLGLL